MTKEPTDYKRINLLIVAKCENRTNGTMQQGSHINGKYKSAILG